MALKIIEFCKNKYFMVSTSKLMATFGGSTNLIRE